MANLTEVDEAGFELDVLQAELPTLVDFWAEWCGPCRMMAPELEKLAAAHAGRLNVVKLDVQAFPGIAMRYGIMNIPTLILFVDGEPKERLVGYMPLKKILEKLSPYLAS